MIYLSPRPEQNPVERASLSVRGEVYIRCELEEKRKRAVKRMNGGKEREKERERLEEDWEEWGGGNGRDKLVERSGEERKKRLGESEIKKSG